MRRAHPPVLRVAAMVAWALHLSAGLALADEGGASRGEEIYVEFCQGCHGAGKAGLLDFSRTREELQLILEGETEQMPDFYGIFSETEVDAIYAYLSAPVNP